VFYAKKLNTNNLFHPQINQLINENLITYDLIELQEKKTQKVLNKLYGIFSVSLNYRNQHLWKIFGGNNKEFCVGLNFKEFYHLMRELKVELNTKKLTNFRKVKYLIMIMIMK